MFHGAGHPAAVASGASLRVDPQLFTPYWHIVAASTRWNRRSAAAGAADRFRAGRAGKSRHSIHWNELLDSFIMRIALSVKRKIALVY
jgi:hypothetical protein